MSLKLSDYINDQNRKMDSKAIRKHLLDILPSELLDVNFQPTIKKNEISELQYLKFMEH